MSMQNRARLFALVLLCLLCSTRVVAAHGDTAPDPQVTLTLVGQVVNSQGRAVDEAEVRVLLDGVQQTLTVASDARESTHTNAEGFFIVDIRLPEASVESGAITVEVFKAGFRTARQGFDAQELALAGDHYYVSIPTVVLSRVFNPAFFLSTAIFVVVFGLISLNLLHETIAAFLGATAMLGVSYLVGTFDADFWIIGFEQAVKFIDFDVIFLIMSLMIVVSIIGRTGIFQWLALAAYRTAGGNAWRMAVILVVATAVLSAFLNNVTIMLLMAPITLQIAVMLGINPAALIIPEAMGSNIGGIATLIGDPPNTVIGSYAGLGFNEFLIHLGPIALIATLTLIAVVYVIYRKDYATARQLPSHALLVRLERDARITDPQTLRRGLLIIGVMLILFFSGELFHMPPSVVGLIGATALLVWVRPDVEEMLGEVDWTTLMFFICLFMVVGGVQEAGLIQWIADLIANAAGADLELASQSVIWLSAIASAIVNNIPFTTAALPIAAFLTRTVPGAANNVLYWSLSLGANLGGNATYIGSAPNVVAVGVLDRAGYRVTFADWLRVGIPVTFATVLVSTIWLWIRYFWLKF